MKNGRTCSNYQPQRKGNCANQKKRSQTPCAFREDSNASNVSSVRALAEEESIATKATPQDSDCERLSSTEDPFSLPNFVHCARPNFQWSERVDAACFIESIKAAYKEMITWRRNIFSVPSGKMGLAFVSEVSRLFKCYAESSALESISLMAVMVLPALVLQKPFPNMLKQKC